MKCWPSFSSQYRASSQAHNVRFQDIGWGALNLSLELAERAVDAVPVPELTQAVGMLAALLVTADVGIFF